MKTKICFKCGKQKKLADFYSHPGMADGHLNKCKECTKADVKARSQSPEGRAYERSRRNLPHRVKARQAYAKTADGKKAHARAARKWRENNAYKRAAHTILSNAVRDGKVIPQPCWVCGRKAEAHHPDYDAPLDVVWLCTLHHKQTHAMVNPV